MVCTACLDVNVVLLEAAAKILAIKVCTSIDQPGLPCQPACLVLCLLLVFLFLLKLTFCKLKAHLHVSPISH